MKVLALLVVLAVILGVVVSCGETEAQKLAAQAALVKAEADAKVEVEQAKQDTATLLHNQALERRAMTQDNWFTWLIILVSLVIVASGSLLALQMYLNWQRAMAYGGPLPKAMPAPRPAPALTSGPPTIIVVNVGDAQQERITRGRAYQLLSEGAGQIIEGQGGGQ